MAGCICHINGYEVKDAAARKRIEEVKTETQQSLQDQQTQLDTALQQQQTQLDTALQEQQTQLDTALQQQQIQFNTAQQQQQTQFDTALQEQKNQLDKALEDFEETAAQTQQEAEQALNNIKNFAISAESWDLEISPSDSPIWHECSGNVVAVFVSAARLTGDNMVSGVWTPATSGITNHMYGTLNTNPDTWTTAVYIDKNKVSITRSGVATLHYYVTALIAGGNTNV